MNIEVTAPFKQEDLCKELPIDIDESPEFKSVPRGVITEDVVQLKRSIGEPEIVESGNGLGSDAKNPHLPHNHDRNQVAYTGTHDNETMTAAIKLDDLVKELLIDESLEFESDSRQCCIYKVPKRIRRVNEELYTPELISIGPLHHGKPELADMEEKKKRYVKSFIQRTTEEKISMIPSFIKDREEQIRACYTETFTLKSPEFVKMIFYDSIFIIEIFLRETFRDRSDILLDTKPINLTLTTDLQLFENQLPYFILEEIYKLAFTGTEVLNFMELSVGFFGEFMGVELSTSTTEVKHFTDWRRISLLESYPLVSDKKEIYDLPCAAKLHESGLKFKCIEIKTGQSVLDVKFEKPKHLISFFRANELRIPRIEIYDSTERLLRNIMALEQCLYPENAQVCNYVELMDFLINAETDVDLLIGNGIISNHMGDNASVATMFNKLNQYVLVSKSSYHNLCEQLKEHYSNPWNRAKATLKRVYFSNPWRGTATGAAIILLLLTIIGTVCSILQVV